MKIGLNWLEDGMRKWEVILSRALSPFPFLDGQIEGMFHEGHFPVNGRGFHAIFIAFCLILDNHFRRDFSQRGLPKKWMQILETRVMSQ